MLFHFVLSVHVYFVFLCFAPSEYWFGRQCGWSQRLICFVVLSERSGTVNAARTLCTPFDPWHSTICYYIEVDLSNDSIRMPRIRGHAVFYHFILFFVFSLKNALSPFLLGGATCIPLFRVEHFQYPTPFSLWTLSPYFRERRDPSGFDGTNTNRCVRVHSRHSNAVDLHSFFPFLVSVLVDMSL